MKKISVLSISLLTIVFCCFANAAQISGKIVDLIVYSDGHAVIKIDNQHENGCPTKKYYSLGIKGRDTKAEPSLSLALMAYTTDTTVTLNTLDGNCQGGEEKLGYIRLRK